MDFPVYDLPESFSKPCTDEEFIAYMKINDDNEISIEDIDFEKYSDLINEILS